MYNFYPKILLQPPGSCTAKILLVMKLTTLLLITVILHVSASAVAQKITLAEKNVPLDKVLDQINSQTGYDFVFTTSTLKNSKPVNINVKNEELAKVLEVIFNDQPLTYAIDEKTVIIKEKEPSLDQIKAGFAQITIQGKVKDETDQPMVGVTVRQKGTNNVVVTDNRGTYTLTVTDNNSIISFSYIGYETEELAAKEIPTGSVIVLKPATENLKEIVINKGYYDEKRELSTGDIGIVSSKVIEEQPVTDPILALEGRVPGLFVAQLSGQPGSQSTIQIRGQNSIFNGNSPLFLVDGVPYPSSSLTNLSSVGTYLSPFNSLNPSDIENIEVLKDADATAIYGSRGANGVILITTKKGKAGKTKVNVNVYQGAGRPATTAKFMNTQQYLQMRNQAFANDGETPTPENDPDLLVWDTTRYTNWGKVLTGNTVKMTNANLSISGGNTNTQFLVSGNFSNQTTPYPGNFFDQKAAGHANLTHNSTDQKFKLVLSIDYNIDKNVLPSGDPTSLISQLAPDSPPIYNADGTLNFANSTWSNPLANFLKTATATTDNFNSSMNLSYDLLPNLKIITLLGYNNIELNSYRATPSTATDPAYASPYSTNAAEGLGQNISWIAEPQIDYSKKWKNSSLDALVGTTFQENTTHSFTATGFGFSSDALIQDLALAPTTHVGNVGYTQYKLNKVFGRIGYNYKEKYIVNLTGSREGSSRFGPGHQIGNFGALGVGWIFSKEKFIQDNFSWLSTGKLRGSYGTTGNDQTDDYGYLSTYGGIGESYQGVSALIPTNLSNPNYSWEVDKKLETGIDLGFFKDRISISLSYYRNRATNQLLGYQLPNITGYSSVTSNFPAVVQNSGEEISLHTRNIENKDFTWSSSFNISIPKNELLSFPGLANSSYAGFLFLGKPLTTLSTLTYTGVDKHTGIYTFEDVNHDGAITYPEDYNATVNPFTPRFYGGLQNSLRYKNFQLDVFFQFTKQIANSAESQLGVPGTFESNQLANLSGVWQKPGNNAAVEKYTQDYGSDAANAWYNWASSNAAYVDASYIRLKNLSISYNLTDSFAKRLGVQNARIYFQGQNLLTFTHYQGFDPETNNVSVLSPIKMFTCGIQLTL
jgi:TonB-linked SusC/RagA family outer membrane protein